MAVTGWRRISTRRAANKRILGTEDKGYMGTSDGSYLPNTQSPGSSATDPDRHLFRLETCPQYSRPRRELGRRCPTGQDAFDYLGVLSRSSAVLAGVRRLKR
jgi:hypothetical protein